MQGRLASAAFTERQRIYLVNRSLAGIADKLDELIIALEEHQVRTAGRAGELIDGIAWDDIEKTAANLREAHRLEVGP